MYEREVPLIWYGLGKYLGLQSVEYRPGHRHQDKTPRRCGVAELQFTIPMAIGTTERNEMDLERTRGE